MKDTNKTNLQKALDNFISELKELAESNSESDFDIYLREEVAPALKEDDQVFSTSIFSKLEIAVEVHGLNAEIQTKSIEQAMRRMDTKSVCWILNHLEVSKEALSILHNLKKGYSIDDNDVKFCSINLEQDVNELQRWTNESLHQRIQFQEHDIKTLKEAK